VCIIDLLRYGLTAAMLGSTNLGPSVFLVIYYNFVERGSFATKFGTHSITDSVNKCCKFSYCMITTSLCAHMLWLNHMFRCMV